MRRYLDALRHLRCSRASRYTFHRKADRKFASPRNRLMYSTHMLPKVYDYAVCSGFVASWTTTSHLQRHVRLSANARGLGTGQADSVGPFIMQLSGYLTSIPGAGAGNWSLNGGAGSSLTTSFIQRFNPMPETRPDNTAFTPFINL